MYIYIYICIYVYIYICRLIYILILLRVWFSHVFTKRTNPTEPSCLSSSLSSSSASSWSLSSPAQWQRKKDEKGKHLRSETSRNPDFPGRFKEHIYILYIIYYIYYILYILYIYIYIREKPSVFHEKRAVFDGETCNVLPPIQWLKPSTSTSKWQLPHHSRSAGRWVDVFFWPSMTHHGFTVVNPPYFCWETQVISILYPSLPHIFHIRNIYSHLPPRNQPNVAFYHLDGTGCPRCPPFASIDAPWRNPPTFHRIFGRLSADPGRHTAATRPPHWTPRTSPAHDFQRHTPFFSGWVKHTSDIFWSHLSSVANLSNANWCSVEAMSTVLQLISMRDASSRPPQRWWPPEGEDPSLKRTENRNWRGHENLWSICTIMFCTAAYMVIIVRICMYDMYVCILYTMCIPVGAERERGAEGQRGREAERHRRILIWTKILILACKICIRLRKCFFHRDFWGEIEERN